MTSKKKAIQLFSLIIISFNFVTAQTTAIPDPAFEQALIDLGYDDNIDGVVTTSNIVDVPYLDVSMKNIQDLTGIQDFDSLVALECNDNLLTSLEMSQLENLSYLGCHNNQLTSLDVSQFEALSNLDCYNNQLTYLDVSQHNGLMFLSCGNNELDTLIMPEASQNFRELEASNNNLTHLEMTNYAGVAWIAAENNQLNSVDLSGSTVEFAVSFNNNLITEINLDGSDLSYLWLENNQLSFLDLSGLSNLWNFKAIGNPDLDCIKIDQNQLVNNPFGPNSNTWTTDATASYALECSVASVNQANQNACKIYPIPAHDQLHISGINSETNLTVYDLTGKVLIQQTPIDDSQINISILDPGMYLLAIEGIGTKIFQKK